MTDSEFTEKNIPERPKALLFDLDNTLAPSKQPISPDMSVMLYRLLSYVPVVIISGASLKQLMTQVVDYLPGPLSLNGAIMNLYLFPENGAVLYTRRMGEWKAEYEEKLTDEEKKKILDALHQLFQKFGITGAPKKEYGDIVEDRGSQITFSALGQQAPLNVKSGWDPDQAKRKAMVAFIRPMLDEFEINIGGTSSIDITRKGFNKEYAIKRFVEFTKIEPKDILFFGDAIYPGGNDEIVAKSGVPSHKVSNPQETLAILGGILEVYGKGTTQ